MKVATKAIYDRLVGDATLVSLLGGNTYNPAGAAGALPPVFSPRPIPSDAPLPLVAIHPISGANFDSKTHRGRDLLYDISVFTKATGSEVALEDIVERVRLLLHRYLLSVTGWTTLIAEVTGPVEAPADETLYGRTLTLRLVLSSQ